MVRKQLKRYLLSFLSLYGTLFANMQDDAVSLARQGAYWQALPMLEKLYRQNPDDMKIRYDYITVLCWANRNEKALSLAKGLHVEELPDFVLQNLAKAAKDTSDYERAVRWYIAGAKKYDKPSYYLGLAQTLQLAGKKELALSVLAKAKRRFAQQKRTLLQIARLYEAQKNYFEAMKIYQEFLDDPALHDEVVVRLVGVLRRLKMVYKAEELVKANPNLFEKQLPTLLKNDEVAFSLRWFTQESNAQNIDKIRKANSALDGLIKRLYRQNPDISKNIRLQNAFFDKMVALYALSSYPQVCRLYEKLQNSGIKVPPYALKAAAKSYVKLQKPYKAQKLFKQILAQKPDDFGSKIDLFYSYCDAYEMQKAKAWLNFVDREEPVRIWDKNHLKKVKNPKKEVVLLLKALWLEYAGYTPEAEKALTNMVEKAPANVWYLNELAKFYFYEGEYTKAEKLFDRIFALDAKNFDANVDMLALLLARREYEAAGKKREFIRRNYFYRTYDLSRMQQMYKRYTSGYFHIAMHADDSQNKVAYDGSTQQATMEVVSPLLGYHWRLYIEGNYVHETNPFTLTDHRYMLGTLYQNPYLQLRVGAVYQEDRSDKFTPQVDVTIDIDDDKRLRLGYEKEWGSISARALANGIRAEYFYAEANYRFRSYSDMSLRYNLSRYSDGNDAQSLSLSAKQRMLFGPLYQLDAAIYAGADTNSKTERPYYAPEEDAYLSLSLINRWNLYTLYSKRVVTQLSFDMGRHWEKGYDAQWTGGLDVGLMYEHSDTLGMEVGYSRTRASYDGEVEYASGYRLNLHGSF